MLMKRASPLDKSSDKSQQRPISVRRSVNCHNGLYSAPHVDQTFMFPTIDTGAKADCRYLSFYAIFIDGRWKDCSRGEIVDFSKGRPTEVNSKISNFKIHGLGPAHPPSDVRVFMQIPAEVRNKLYYTTTPSSSLTLPTGVLDRARGGSSQ